jgi:hypothetical protein
MSNPRGYDYLMLLTAVAERDEGKCWVRELLLRRRDAQIAAWGAGQTEQGDTKRNWVPKKLLDCDGPWDAHHLGLSKSWLKREFPDGCGDRTLADLLNDPRNCVLVERRHHDMLEAHLIVVRRGDLPEHVEEFAAELGDKAVARLERDFGPFPTSLIERV